VIDLLGLRTPLIIRTIARRTAVTLMGSKVAFRTRTGSCMMLASSRGGQSTRRALLFPCSGRVSAGKFSAMAK